MPSNETGPRTQHSMSDSVSISLRLSCELHGRWSLDLVFCNEGVTERPVIRRLLLRDDRRRSELRRAENFQLPFCSVNLSPCTAENSFNIPPCWAPPRVLAS